MSFLSEGTDHSTTEDYLEKIVAAKGEQWKDPSVLAKGYQASQDHIAMLEKANAEMKEDLLKSKTAEDILKQLQESQAPTPTPVVPGDTDTGATTPEPVSEDALKSLIAEALTKSESDNTVKQNLAKADAELTKVYGTEVSSVVNQRATELGMSIDRLKEIAGESPAAFLKLVGGAKEAPKASPNSSVNTDAVFANQSTARNYEFYSKMRRENPKLYYTAKVQNQMLSDSNAQGTNFY